VFADEFQITDRVRLARAYSSKGQHCLQAQSPARRTVNVLIAVSEQFGLEGMLIFETPIKSEMFVQILNQVDCHGQDYCIVLDNCSVHKSKYTLAEFKRRKVFAVFDPPYCP
jgi:hypothetical protein